MGSSECFESPKKRVNLKSELSTTVRGSISAAKNPRQGGRNDSARGFFAALSMTAQLALYRLPQL